MSDFQPLYAKISRNSQAVSIVSNTAIRLLLTINRKSHNVDLLQIALLVAFK